MACYSGFLAGREAARVMLARGKGNIFFTGATASLRGGNGFAAFASAKFGLRAVAQSMARELGPDGIRVNCIAPGLLNNEATAGVPQVKREWNIQNRAIQREGSPEDIAGLVSFLLSDEASFITGQLIVANGGLVFH